MPGYWGTGEDGRPEWREYNFYETPGDNSSGGGQEYSHLAPAPAGTPSGTPYAPAPVPPPSTSGGTAPTPNIGSGAASNPQNPTFQTVEGPKTASQMYSELMGVGWDGVGDVYTTYQAVQRPGQAHAPIPGETVTFRDPAFANAESDGGVSFTDPAFANAGGMSDMRTRVGDGSNYAEGSFTVPRPSMSMALAPVPGQTYQTVSGPRTLQQMEQELRAVGWQGGEDVLAAYTRTAKAPTPPAAPTVTPPQSPSTQQTVTTPTTPPAPAGAQPITRATADGKAITFYSPEDAALWDQQLARFAEDQRKITEFNQGIEQGKLDLQRAIAEADKAYKDAMLQHQDRALAQQMAIESLKVDLQKQALEIQRANQAMTVAVERERLALARRQSRGARTASVRYR